MKNKIIFHILDFIFLIISYMLCDYLTTKFNLLIGIIICLPTYMIIIFSLQKFLKVK